MEVTPETVAAAVSSVAAARGKGTLPNLMAFARALKQLGVKVSLSQVLDASRSVELVDIAEKTDFRALLRANLISQKEDFPAFDMLFDCFWREQSLRADADGDHGNSRHADRVAMRKKAATKKAGWKKPPRDLSQGKFAAGKSGRIFGADL